MLYCSGSVRKRINQRKCLHLPTVIFSQHCLSTTLIATTKYIFITGGVTSSSGKGIIAASPEKLLQARGYRVTIPKLDPYINVAPGTMNLYKHGECYMTEDNAEMVLELGNYERFIDITTSQANNEPQKKSTVRSSLKSAKEII
jgi:CTP synthase N-terminus